MPTLLLPSRAVASFEPVSVKSFVIVYPYKKNTQSTLQFVFNLANTCVAGVSLLGQRHFIGLHCFF